jgi:hypothetical protein
MIMKIYTVEYYIILSITQVSLAALCRHTGLTYLYFCVGVQRTNSYAILSAPPCNQTKIFVCYIGALICSIQTACCLSFKSRGHRVNSFKRLYIRLVQTFRHYACNDDARELLEFLNGFFTASNAPTVCPIQTGRLYTYRQKS